MDQEIVKVASKMNQVTYVKYYSKHPLTLAVEIELFGQTISVGVDELTKDSVVPSTNEVPDVETPNEFAFERKPSSEACISLP